MIKVLQLNGDARVIQCPDCRAILHYEISDIRRDEYGVNDFIVCPLCKEAIFSIPENRANHESFYTIGSEDW